MGNEMGNAEDHPNARILLVAALEDGRRSLDEMFGGHGAIGRLAVKHSGHPAVRQALAIDEVVAAGHVDRIREFELLSQVADLFIDLRSWPRSTSSDFWEFIPDPNARRRVAANIENPEKYEETLAEVDMWSSLLARGLAADLLEEEGLPDIRIRDTDQTTWAEVKSIGLGTNPRNVGNAVTKANQQLKRGDPENAGLLFVRLSRPVHRAALDDRIPSDVEPYLDEIRRQMAGPQNRSVGLAIAYWSDFLIYDDGAGRATHAYRRRFVQIDHAQPRTPTAVSGNVLDVGRTFVVSIGYPTLPSGVHLPELPALSEGDYDVMPLFRQVNEFTYGIRPQHAFTALAEADAVETINGGIVLALRRVSERGYVLLILARREGDRTQLMLGFRIDDPAEQAIPRGTLPRKGLDVLLDRCGVQTELGGHVALLHPAAVVDEFAIRTVGEASDRGLIQATVRPRVDGKFDVVLAFAIDQDRYDASLRR